MCGAALRRVAHQPEAAPVGLDGYSIIESVETISPSSRGPKSAQHPASRFSEGSEPAELHDRPLNRRSGPLADNQKRHGSRGRMYFALAMLMMAVAATLWHWQHNQARWPGLDAHLAVFLNSCAGRWWTLDRFAKFLQSNDLAQGLFSIAVFYYVWFQPREFESTAQTVERRQQLLFTLFMCIPAVLTARAAALLLPYRMRPIFNPALHLHLAHTFDPQLLISWSSFPSDHAVFYFTLATGIFLISRKAGLLLYLHAVLVICLPRLYLGVHYPSDILTGALLGCGFGYSTQWRGLRSLATQPAFRLRERSMGVFHAALFYFAYETAHMYEDLRRFGIGVWQVARALLRL
jgi:undecaprenyl-diphosphatase